MVAGEGEPLQQYDLLVFSQASNCSILLEKDNMGGFSGGDNDTGGWRRCARVKCRGLSHVKGGLGRGGGSRGRGTLVAIQSAHAFCQASNLSILLGKDNTGGFKRRDNGTRG